MPKLKQFEDHTTPIFRILRSDILIPSNFSIDEEFDLKSHNMSFYNLLMPVRQFIKCTT